MNPTPKRKAKKPLNLGNLGRSSIADLTIGSVTSSPATRSVVVSATGTIQPVAAEVLEGFVKVFEGYYTRRRPETEEQSHLERRSAQTRRQAAEEKAANDHIKSGEALGSFNFTAIGE